MNLLIQFQCVFYSFIYGFVMSGVYHIINRLFYKIPRFLRYLLQCVIAAMFGIFYFYGLVLFNEGILRFYFFLFIFLGYLFYNRYYAYYLLYYLEKWIRIFKRIISPFIFFFRYFNGIIQKRAERVKHIWQKRRRKKQRDIKNS